MKGEEGGGRGANKEQRRGTTHIDTPKINLKQFTMSSLLVVSQVNLAVQPDSIASERLAATFESTKISSADTSKFF